MIAALTNLPMLSRQRDPLKGALLASGTVHLVIILLLVIGLPIFVKPLPPPPDYFIPVEVTDIGAITNTRVKETPEPPKPPVPDKKDEAKPTPPPPAEKPPEEVKAKEPPKPVQKTEVDDAALPDKIKKIKEKVIEQQETKPEMLTSVLKNVAKLKTQTPPDDAKPQKKTDEAQQPQSLAPALSERLSISQEDALRRQIQQCWNMPVGARDADRLVVEVLIEVNPDRTVQAVQVVDQGRYNSDGFFRAAAEAAVRAVRNPRCSPLELPPDKYQTWKTIRFNFDPRDML